MPMRLRLACRLGAPTSPWERANLVEAVRTVVGTTAGPGHGGRGRGPLPPRCGGVARNADADRPSPPIAGRPLRRMTFGRTPLAMSGLVELNSDVPPIRMDGRVVEGGSLENCCTGDRTGGSNPSPSALGDTAGAGTLVPASPTRLRPGMCSL